MTHSLYGSCRPWPTATWWRTQPRLGLILLQSIILFVKHSATEKRDRKQAEERSQTTTYPELLPDNHSPAHAIGGINHMPIPRLGSRLCWRLQLSSLPVNRSSKGDTQACCTMIGIMVEHKYKPAVLAVYCLEGTAPTSWSVIQSPTYPFSPNYGLCCQCRIWRLFCMGIFTSTQQTNW